MLKNRMFTKITCFASALCLLPGLCLPAVAQEAETTAPPAPTVQIQPLPEPVPPSEETQPPELTAPPTEPAVSAPTTVATEPPATEPAALPTEPTVPAPATVPVETEPTLAPTESAPVTEPAEETLPAQVPPDSEPELTLSQAIALPEDFPDSFLTSGTVIYASEGILVLQDGPVGALFFCSGETAAFGQRITLRCIAGSQGFTILQILSCESGILPQPLASTLSQAPEGVLLALKNVTIGSGAIVQDGASLLLSGPLPAAFYTGDRVHITGIRLGEQFVVQSIEPAQEEDPAVLWHAAQPQDIQPEDVVALTITTRKKETFLLGRTADGGFTSTPVQPGVDTLEHPDEGIGWNLSWQEDKFSLQSPQGWLSSNIKLSGKMQLSDTPDFWQVEKDYLYNPRTSVYLVHAYGAFRTSVNHGGTQLSGQQLRFWVKDHPEPEPTVPPTSEPTTPPQTTPAPTEETTQPTLPPEPPEYDGLHAYFGQLHGHSSFSGGELDAQTLFANAAQQMDFFAITDPSHSLDDAEWTQGRQAAAAATGSTFLGLYGYEMAWAPDTAVGHITVLSTDDWVSEDTETGFLDLEGFYSLLADTPGAIGQFNHPGPFWGDFQSFLRTDARYDNAMQLLDVTGENGRISADIYEKALAQGWHIAPTYNSSHLEAQFPGRTMVLAADLSENAILDALRQRRVCATEDPDLQMHFTLNGAPMGSLLPYGGGQLTAQLWDATDPIGRVELMGDSGPLGRQEVQEHQGTLVFTVPEGIDYCYLKVTQPDGDIALSAPVWMEHYEDIGIQDFSCQTPVTQNIPTTLTLTLYNQESAPLEILSVTLETEAVEGIMLPFSLAPGEIRRLEIPYTCAQPGVLQLTAQITGRIGGQPVQFRQSLVLRCLPQMPQEITAQEVLRTGQEGTAYRIRGYATSGTCNPHNRFPQMLYLQDDTGGIAVTEFYDESIQVGTPMEVAGILKNQQGNLVLEMLEYTILPDAYYRHVPQTTRCDLAVNYAANGGKLVQVEGKVLSLTPTKDGKGIRRMTICDHTGEQATILIEPYIFAGSTGENTLLKQITLGCTLRAMGLCHRDSSGQCVVRVRNCEEVVYIPPRRPDPSNPKTGDDLLARREAGV